jgi:hypothetical protein
MERNFNRDFEKLLKENADQYRMYPSEKVWEGVHDALHGRRKKYGLYSLALLLLAGLSTSVYLFNASEEKVASENKSSLIQGEKLQAVSNPVAPKAFDENPILSEEIKPGTLLQASNNNLVLANTETRVETEGIKSAITPGFSVEKATIDITALAEKSDKPESQPRNPEFSGNVSEKISTPKTGKGIPAHNQEMNEALNMLASRNAPEIATRKQKRFTTLFYFTPTISYRKLSENKKPDPLASFTNAPVLDVNNMVKHKPAMGLEFGLEERYRISGKFFVKAGLQFNINRYDVRAYHHPVEVATVAINRDYRTDSIFSLSSYRNFNGTNANWLENFYFQAALPVGAEIILAENKNLKFGVSGTIQPTYNIGDRVYLISSNYRNYAKFPDLIRRWNLSSGLETFVSYSTGKLNWTAGPHLRYQHFSSFVSGYPVKENLFAVGLKVGISFQQ